ncbi:MAG TPA: hypothetical protein VL523_15855, partial [Terriglobia bacterium]|nr:hypothetical protein [Terriglobia bacterium]
MKPRAAAGPVDGAPPPRPSRIKASLKTAAHVATGESQEVNPGSYRRQPANLRLHAFSLNVKI